MAKKPPAVPVGRKLSRAETHDLGMIIKERTKVLRHHVEAEGTRLLADFEKQIAAQFTFDQDEVWKKAAEQALEAVRAADAIIAERCENLGVPRSFRPGLTISWHGRGENMLRERRVELRAVAKAEVKAMMAGAVMKVEREALDLRTQVVSLGLVTEEAQAFLQTLKPVESVMHELEFGAITAKLDSLPPAQRAQIKFDS
jgi:hypothetical protein